ncbi:chitinase [Streptomyces cinereoruber]|uniref:chitinase n=1 Tax=Streptomyces cinereoruber TaxID=67260 RepID=A0AAV4KBX0_9ACTN|nr:glycosyl hydrolase family 18 protein [Streptomyces cinereoruber]AVH95725.1 chitinase [Streptomyces sp. WAC00288]KYG54398.1 chitinase [Streptomyces sp. WAC04657]MBB4157296.1 chitinase [Streptomyces cinereoruber]NIH59606.1 chitinase [Streptomyces cinereoruber]QEV36970.1 chitinase [Streptomyces cinereoruber]
MDRTTTRPHGRRWLGGALALAVGSGIVLVGGAGTAQAADVNVARNAGFENGLANWACSAGSGAAVSSPVRTGTGALRAAPAGLDNAKCVQTVTVKPNSTYTLSAWVQGGYAYLGASGTGTGTGSVSTWSPDSPSWKQLTTTFTTGASTTSVEIYTHGWYGTSPYLVDDVSVFGPDGGGVPDPDPVVPTTPAGLAAGGTTSSSVSLSWGAVSGATSYKVYRDGVAPQTVSGTSATITGLAADTAYQFQVSAVNSAGESAKSAAVTARTAKNQTGPGPAVPKHAVTGYWQNFDNGAAKQKLRDVQAAYDIIAVSFADSTATPGQIVFNLDPAVGYSSVAEFKSDVAAKKAAGKSVIISVGGEKGNVTINSDASATAFANSTYALMQEYGFNGVDIDLEHGINSTYLTKALRQLSAKAGPGMVLTMAPQTIDMQNTGTEYFKTALAVKDILTVINTQYYNSGSMLGCDGKVYSQGSVDFLTALACIQIQGGLDPSQVGLGVPASTRGAGSGYVSPQIVNNALDCLTKLTNCGNFKPAQAWPSLRGAMTWSTNWDATAGNAWSNAVGPHVHGLP